MCHRAELTNVNRRWYGRALLEREVASFTSQARDPRIACRRCSCGLMHPRIRCSRALVGTALPVGPRRPRFFTLRWPLTEAAGRRRRCPLAQLLLRGSAIGELDHPAPDSPHFRRINRDNASHRLLDLWWEGNELHATVQVLPTRAGELIRDVYLAGHKCACCCADVASQC